MQATMQAEDFCRAMMVELEDHWTHARGHQERHPIREKIRQLEWITEQVAQGADLSAILASGKVCDDAVRCLVCEELQPRWEAARPRS